MLAHLFAYVGIPALLALAGIRLRDELFEKTETYRTFRDPQAPGRASLGHNAEIRSRSAKGCLASRYLRKNLGCLPRFDRARLPRCWFSCNFFACRRIM